MEKVVRKKPFSFLSLTSLNIPIFSTLLENSKASVGLSIVASFCCGLSNAMLIAFITKAISSRGDIVDSMFIVYFVLLIAVFLCGTWAQIIMVKLGNKAVYDMQMIMVDKILSTPFEKIQKIGDARLYAVLTGDVHTISDAFVSLTRILFNSCILAGGILYLGYLSLSYLAIVLGLLVFGLSVNRYLFYKVNVYLRPLREAHDSLYKNFNALIYGFKELTLHKDKKDKFYHDSMAATAAKLRDNHIKSLSIWGVANDWSIFIVFLIIGTLLFMLSVSSEANEIENIIGFVITIMFLRSPLAVIMNCVPDIARGNIALKKITSLELAEPTGQKNRPTENAQDPITWDTVKLNNIQYEYQTDDDAHFKLGPLSLDISRGEIIFVIGGNGSGKSTLAYLISGLYNAHGGDRYLNGKRVADETLDWYRSHFSAIFSDYYLFDDLLDSIQKLDDGEKITEYLKQLKLDKKVKFKNGTLTTTKLSQGQRKRLALLFAYLDDRPIYLFDEWAADQDPLFKNFFYKILLPNLKASGKTVIAITHDERYFHIPDKIYKLEDGKLIDYRVAAPYNAPHFLDQREL